MVAAAGKRELGRGGRLDSLYVVALPFYFKSRDASWVVTKWLVVYIF